VDRKAQVVIYNNIKPSLEKIMKTILLAIFSLMYADHASALFGKGSLVCVTKKCREARAKAADTYNKTGNCDGLGGKDKAKCEKYKKKDDRKMGKLSEEAKKIVLEGGNCDALKGKDKRTCKRASRQKARIISRASAAEGGDCAGKSGKDLRQCQRTIKRDEKGKRGAFGFIGEKKANKLSQENWAAFNACKTELDKLKSSQEITQADYDSILEQAENARLGKSQIIGRQKAIKTGVAIGVVAATAATGGLAAGGIGIGAATSASAAIGLGASTAAGVGVAAGVGAVGAGTIGAGVGAATRKNKKLAGIEACNMDAIALAKANHLNAKNAAIPQVIALAPKVRSIKFAADGKVAKGSIYVLTSTGLCKKLSKNEPWHESAHYNNIIDCKKAAFQKRSLAGDEAKEE
jgi:hypothetical protein